MKYQFQWIDRISQVNQTEWNRLTANLDTPIFNWEWLYCLEESGSICPDTGWQPSHLLVYKNTTLIAAAVLYIKFHSWGEFVFDFEWAELASKLQIPYYPKLVGVCPATPSSGYRFLTLYPTQLAELTPFLLEEMEKYIKTHKIHSINFLYVDQKWAKHLNQKKFIHWQHQNYCWQNKDFQDFDHYIASFKKNQRKNIRHERRLMNDQNIKILTLTKSKITKELLDLMYNYYEKTNQQFGIWGAKYLNRKFFHLLYDYCKEHLLLFAAFLSNQKQPA
ncbi:MAG: GNAT family N-acetyltransferase, partial [Spirochaetes bacterium]|nr:GNAT family N-acetyltransferase [Spirochaetota bacterium]